MPYNPTVWARRIVDHPHRYTLTLVAGDTYDIEAAHGAVIQAGTPLSEANLTNVETQYAEAKRAARKISLFGV